MPNLSLIPDVILSEAAASHGEVAAQSKDLYLLADALHEIRSGNILRAGNNATLLGIIGVLRLHQPFASEWLTSLRMTTGRALLAAGPRFMLSFYEGTARHYQRQTYFYIDNIGSEPQRPQSLPSQSTGTRPVCNIAKRT